LQAIGTRSSIFLFPSDYCHRVAHVIGSAHAFGEKAMTVANAHVPFLDLQSFAVAEAESLPAEPRSSTPLRSPFLSVYELDGRADESSFDDPVRDAYATLVNELHEEEFDEALFELRSHIRAMHDEQLSMGSSRADADRIVTQHFLQLVRESEAMVDAMAREFGMRDETGIADQEIDSFISAYAPTGLDPEFEDFFGKLAGKLGRFAKAAAGTAWRGIKKVALGPIFSAIRAVLKPILNGVLQQAIGRLPAQVQPAAQQLAQKLGLQGAAAALPAAGAADAALPTMPATTGGAAVQDAAGQDAVSTQQELDEQLAATLLAQDEVELNLETAQLRTDASGSARPVFAELDDARERFIEQLSELGEGDNAMPHVQQFLPAVLPALRVGLRLAGRPRVIDFLGQLLTRLIGKLIGPAQAPALSRAIVDAGFKLLNLEMPESELPRLGASAVAATVEQTIGRVAALPDFVLDNQELLEGFALEAFEHAAAANLPALFSQVIYRQRPELLEAGVNAGWVLLPLRGRKRYKRCTRTFKIRLSPHMADEVESFEGAVLSDYLRDQLGMADGDEVDAQLNLYETLPGTSLADIAHGERASFGPGLSDETNAAQLHPLTPRAAAVMLGKPSLGRAWDAASNPHTLAAGQRLYHLATGARPLTVPDPGRRSRLRRRFHVGITLDRPQDRIRVCVFISEVKAQKLAVRLRNAAGVGTVAPAFHSWMGRRLERIFLGDAHGRLRVVHAGMRPGPGSAAAVANLPQAVRQAFMGRLHEWLVRAFADFAKTQSQRFLAASDDAADGVTLRFIIEHPQGLKEFMAALVERGAPAGAAAAAIAGADPATVRVDVFPGHRCG
jgi:hypothetical protein